MKEYVEQKRRELEAQVFMQTKRADFEDFWADAVAALRKKPLSVKREKKLFQG